MKKLWMPLLTAMLLMHCAACCENSGRQTDSPGPPAVGSQAPELGETAGAYLRMGDSVTLGCWEITVTDFTYTEQLDALENSFLACPSEERSRYGLASVTVVFLGAATEGPLVSFADLKASLLHQGEYEFGLTSLPGVSPPWEPLDSRSGFLPFPLPDAVAGSEDLLLLRFSLGQETAVYRIR